MKNLILTSALAAALAGTALANDSTIDQIDGSSNAASVTQTNGTGAASYVLQTGSDDIATVIQSDSGGAGTNSSTVRQLGGSGTQTATVTQNHTGTGGANIATAIQDSIEGGNLIALNQDGDGNTATAQQGPGIAKNCSVFGGSCSSTNPRDITNSTTEITQSGTANTAVADQIVGSNGGDNNQANIIQDGTSNDAEIAQGTGTVRFWTMGPIYISDPTSNDNNNIGSIDQTGVGNTSEIGQGGEAGMASNRQDGNDNTSTIVQSGGVSPALGNSASVEQVGSNNNSVVTQSSGQGDLPGVPFANDATVQQFSDDNTSTVTQGIAGGHTVSVLQDGGGGHSSLIVQNGWGNTATLVQSMSDQVSEINQTGPASSPAIGNTAKVTQAATSGNLSKVAQNGVQNSSTVMQ